MGSNVDSIRANLKRHEFRIAKTRTPKYRKIDVSDENVELMMKFDDEKANVFKQLTRMGYLVALTRLAVYLKKKSFKKAEKDDLVRFFQKLRETKVKESTIHAYCFKYLNFFQWLYGLKGRHNYPEVIDWFHPKRNNNIKLPDLKITEDDVKKLIEVASNPRDKALVAVCYESAVRCHELLLMRIGDIKFDEFGGATVMVHSNKTDDRPVVLFDSVPYLKMWLQNHPFKDNPEAYLWIDCVYRTRKWNYGKVLCHTGVWSMLKRLSKKAELKAVVRPHLLRVLRLTILSKFVSEMALRRIAGWKNNSTMVEIYCRYNNVMVKEMVYRNVYNIDIDKKKEGVQERIMEGRTCVCGTKNPMENDWCFSCHRPLNKEKIADLEFAKNLVNQILTECWKNPNPRQALPSVIEKFKENISGKV